MVAEELPHFPRRDRKIGNSRILDGKNSRFRSGEKELRRDLEEGGDYMEAAAEAQCPGGVECQPVARWKWILGPGVLYCCDGDQCEG